MQKLVGKQLNNKSFDREQKRGKVPRANKTYLKKGRKKSSVISYGGHKHLVDEIKKMK